MENNCSTFNMMHFVLPIFTSILLIFALYISFIAVTNTITGIMNRNQLQLNKTTWHVLIAAILWGLFYYFNSTK